MVIYLSNLNSLIGSYNMFLYFVVLKRDIFNLLVYSYLSGRLNSLVIDNSLRINKIIIRFFKGSIV